MQRIDFFFFKVFFNKPKEIYKKDENHSNTRCAWNDLTQSLVQLQINKNEEEQTNEIKMWNNQCGQKGYTTKHSNKKNHIGL